MLPPRLHALVAVAALDLALTGLAGCAPLGDCAAASCAAAPRSLAVATDDSLHYEGRGDYAGLFGTLGGRASRDQACFWIDGRGASVSGRVHLVLPAGYSAVQQPTGRLDLLGPHGELIGHPGERFAVSVTPDLVATPPGCPTGPALGALHFDVAAR